MKIIIEPFSAEYTNQVLDLIIPIQRDEFGVAISCEEQPDLMQIASFYQTGHGNFWMALCENKVVGTIGLKDISQGQLALRKMFVNALFRGAEKGVAQSLLDKAKKWAEAQGSAAIFLGTTDLFHAAHKFYKKNGFVEIDQKELPRSFPVMAVDTKFYRFSIGAETGMP